MDQRNLVLAVVLSMAIILGFNFLVEAPQRDRMAQQQAQQTAQSDDPAALPPGAPPQPAVGQVPGAVPTEMREAALTGPRIAVETPSLQGSISLTGGRLDDLVLLSYRETIDPESANIELLQPVGTPLAYFADYGWTTTGGEVPLPGPETLWQSDGGTLAPDSPVTLSWDNGAGLLFERTFEVDEDYMFRVTQRVTNSGDSAVTLSPYGLISRSGTPPTLGFFILHEGLIAVLDGTLKEIDYSDLKEDGPITAQSTGGWIGITDKYWMATLVPDQSQPITARMVFTGTTGDKYQVDYLQQPRTVAPGGEVAITSHLFAGAKRVSLLDRYAEELGIDRFDLAVDFGWFYFLTKPIFHALSWIYGIVGNFGVAILILTVFIKLLFFPLANKSYSAMAKMRKLQPEMLKLRERFADDKQRMNQELMALYKKEGANPVAGCLPVLIQIPVFFSLYKVLFVTIEMRHAPFFGWIQDLSAPDPTSILNLFGLLPFAVPDLGALNLINLGIWPLLMGISMYIQQQLNPQPADPMQAKIFLFMPIVFTFMLASFPAGLVIYWTWNNVLSILQQYVIMRRAGVPIGRKAMQAAAAASDPKAGTHAPRKGEPANDGTSKGAGKRKKKAKAGD